MTNMYKRLHLKSHNKFPQFDKHINRSIEKCCPDYPLENGNMISINTDQWDQKNFE